MSNPHFTGPQADDYDFAVGSVKGLRSWSIDLQGRLTGVTHKVVWTPGENVARCQDAGGRYEPCPAVQAAVDPSSHTRSILAYVYGAVCDDPTCVPGKGHFVATEGPRHAFDASCECGFWAYNEHDHQSHGAITGVIEAYGKVTIGTRGFRAEKARVLALLRPHDTDDGCEFGCCGSNLSDSMWRRIQQLYPDVAYFDFRDEMVEAHPEVLKTWDTPGEDFWDVEPPEPSRAAGGMTFGNRATWLTPSLQRFMPPTIPTSSGRFFTTTAFADPGTSALVKKTEEDES